MSELREMIRNEMEVRGIIGLANHDTKRFIDPHTGLVPKLIAAICEDINLDTEVPAYWLEYAVNCIIHIKRHNRVQIKEWKDAHGQPRRSVSSEASQSTASSSERKRSSTPIREKTEDDNEPRGKLKAPSIGSVTPIMISNVYATDPFELEYHNISTGEIANTDNALLIKADYVKYREIMTIEGLIKDEMDEV